MGLESNKMNKKWSVVSNLADQNMFSTKWERGYNNIFILKEHTISLNKQ